MRVSFGSAITVGLFCAVTLMSSFALVRSAGINVEYTHFGCYYKVYECGSPPYFIQNQQPNTSIFDLCLALAKIKASKYFAVQAMYQSDCITGPNFQRPLKSGCLKTNLCNQDQNKMSFYSYDIYRIKEVVASPKVLSSPSNQTRNEEETIEIRCGFEGNPFPTISWLKNGKELNLSQHSKRITSNVSRSRYSGISVLRISKLRIGDQGYYTCRVQNKINVTISKQGYLNVRFLQDVFISTPQPYILTLGEKKTSLRCHANGFPHPDLSWYKEGIRVPKSKSILTKIIPSTKITTHLFLVTPGNGVSYKEAGNYTCVAYSSTLNKTTRTTVEVLFKPEIQQKPKDRTALQGSQVSFYCNATGIPEPVISWRFSGSSIHKRTGNSIVIRNLQNTEKYEGRYTCVASSRAGKAEASASLTVDVPPTMNSALPKGVMFQLGETLRLKCDVYGDPEPSFQWTKRVEPEDKAEILASQTKSELIIPDIRLKDAAYYGCTARNRAGLITLGAVFVDIDTSLELINGGENFTAVVEGNVTIRCTASSEITPEVKMKKNGVELQTVTKVSNDKKVVMAEFTVSSVTTEDSGMYTCMATNRQKSVQADIRLLVDVPIKIDMDVTLQSETFSEELKDTSSEKYRNLSTTFIEEMTKIYINETGFERVEVLGFRNGSVKVRFRVIFKVKVQKPEDKPPPDTKVRIANVVVRRVIQSEGVVGKLMIKPDSVKPLVKPPSPMNLTATNIKKKELTIDWKHPLFLENYAVKRYAIKYKEFGSSWEKIDIIGEHVDRFILEDLEADTRYSIRIHAVNHMGEGLPSNVIETQTLSAFEETFAMVFVPLLIIIIVIVIIVFLYLRRRRKQSKEGRTAENITYRQKEHLIQKKKIDEEDYLAMGMVELHPKWKEIPRDRLVLDKELGSGQFGVVFKGLLKEKEEKKELPCAVKMLKPNASQETTRDLFNELEIMASVDEHPNIVNLFGACTGKDGPMYVIVEFAENGSLLDFVRENRMEVSTEDGQFEDVSSLTHKEKIRFAYDVSSGMQHLANHRCVHRDLAARNVLLGKDRIAKVADFGLARDVYERGFYEKTGAGGVLPAKWMSIEALETLKATTESDVWSFGVLLWEIETGGKMPYAGFKFNEILKYLKSGGRLSRPANCREEVYSIMKECWEANPSKRPTFEDLSRTLDELYIHFLEE